MTKLKLDKVSLEQQLAATRHHAASLEAHGGSSGGGATTNSNNNDVSKPKLTAPALARKTSVKSLGVVKSASMTGSKSLNRTATVTASSSSAGKGAGGDGGSITVAKVAELTTEVQRLMAEVAVARGEVASSAQKAEERQGELQQVRGVASNKFWAVVLGFSMILGFSWDLQRSADMG